MDFGSENAASGQNLVFFVLPTAPANVVLNSLTYPTGWSGPAGPFTIAPNGARTIIVSKGVSATSGGLTVNVTFNSGTININVNLNVQAPFADFSIQYNTSLHVPGASTGNLEQVNIATFNFGLSVMNILLANTSTAPNDAVVTAITLNPNFQCNIPLGTKISAGGSLEFQFTALNLVTGIFDPTSSLLYTITFQNTNNTTEFLSISGYLTYFAVQLVPAFTITGSGLVFMTEWGTTLKQMDPTNTNCEESSSLSRQYDFDTPGFEKTVLRIYTRLENQGNVTLTLLLTSTNGDNISKTQQIGVDQVYKVPANKLQGFLWDLIANGEIITFTLTRSAGGGKLSMPLFGFLFSERGEIYEGA